jgi:hypothetical protein
MRSFSELVEEAEAADVTGWDWGWLEGRATEERPPWGYAGLLAEEMADAASAVDLDTGGGEVLARLPVLPPLTVVTEAWPPNVERARRTLGPRGVEVVAVEAGAPLPLPDAAFELVSSRHPVRPDWGEIARVLVDGGTYLAQHVGPASAFELIERFLGLLPDQRRGRDPHVEAAAARAAGLDVVDLRTARCRMEFHDIGAVVWTLRRCVWWVPGFTVEGHLTTLRRLDEDLRRRGPLVAHSTRTLLRARRRARQVG